MHMSMNNTVLLKIHKFQMFELNTATSFLGFKYHQVKQKSPFIFVTYECSILRILICPHNFTQEFSWPLTAYRMKKIFNIVLWSGRNSELKVRVKWRATMMGPVWKQNTYDLLGIMDISFRKYMVFKVGANEIFPQVESTEHDESANICSIKTRINGDV